MIVAQPLQEGGRLGELLHRHRGWSALIGGNRLTQTGEHGVPVEHRHAHIGEDLTDIVLERGAPAFIEQPCHMYMNEALVDEAVTVAALRRKFGQRPRCQSLHRQDGMQDEADVTASLGQERQDRVDQERHVVIEDLHDGDAHIRRHNADLGPAGPAFLEKPDAGSGQCRQFFVTVGGDVVAHRPGKELGREAAGVGLGVQKL